MNKSTLETPKQIRKAIKQTKSYREQALLKWKLGKAQEQAQKEKAESKNKET